MEIKSVKQQKFDVAHAFILSSPPVKTSESEMPSSERSVAPRSALTQVTCSAPTGRVGGVPHLLRIAAEKNLLRCAAGAAEENAIAALEIHLKQTQDSVQKNEDPRRVEELRVNEQKTRDLLLKRMEERVQRLLVEICQLQRRVSSLLDQNKHREQ